MEGIARELVRAVQDARKSAGLEVSDRIDLAVTGSARVEAALREHRGHIMSETLSESLSPDITRGGFEAERKLGEDEWRIVLAKTQAVAPR